jgi:hypothetical protein
MLKENSNQRSRSIIKIAINHQSFADNKLFAIVFRTVFQKLITLGNRQDALTMRGHDLRSSRRESVCGRTQNLWVRRAFRSTRDNGFPCQGHRMPAWSPRVGDTRRNWSTSCATWCPWRAVVQRQTPCHRNEGNPAQLAP